MSGERNSEARVGQVSRVVTDKQEEDRASNDHELHMLLPTEDVSENNQNIDIEKQDGSLDNSSSLDKKQHVMPNNNHDTTDMTTAATILSINHSPSASVTPTPTASAAVIAAAAVSLLDEPMLDLVIRPVDKMWVMGEDWHTRISALMTIMDLKEHVEKYKGISRHRIQMRIKGKVIVPARDNWSLRRIGINDNTIVNVEPTLSGSWTWNDKQFYAEKLLGEVLDFINHAGGTISYVELSKVIQCPPIIKTSLRVFLKTYPERVHCTTDLTSGSIYLQATKHPFDLPKYDTIPIDIGNFVYFKPKYFDWEAHKDVDDMYLIEAFDDEAGIDDAGDGGGVVDGAGGGSESAGATGIAGAVTFDGVVGGADTAEGSASGFGLTRGVVVVGGGGGGGGGGHLTAAEQAREDAADLAATAAIEVEDEHVAAANA